MNISQMEKNKSCMISSICEIKKKPRQTDKTKTKSEGKEVGGREKWVKRSAVWWWTVRLEVTSFVYTNVQLQ